MEVTVPFADLAMLQVDGRLVFMFEVSLGARDKRNVVSELVRRESFDIGNHLRFGQICLDLRNDGLIGRTGCQHEARQPQCRDP